MEPKKIDEQIGSGSSTVSEQDRINNELQEVANSRLHPEYWELVAGQLERENPLEIDLDEEI